jgi:AAA15 family ATPase/GTPase
MEEDSYVDFSTLINILPTLEENTYIFIDEVDKLLFENPIATSATLESKVAKFAVFKAKCLKRPAVKGVIALTATFD